MYGLPEDFDGAFLVGRTLEMLCFNQNQVYLHFDTNVSITIEDSFSYQDGQVVDVPVRESDLMRLLGASVSRVQGDKEGTLSLFFDDGQVLKVYDTTKQYESYRITHDGKDIII